MSEKIGGAKGTELDDEFTEMERVNINNILYRRYTVVWLKLKNILK